MAPTVPLITDIAQLDPSQRYTYADYLSWKFTDVVELIRGRVLRRMAGPARAHQRCSMNFSRLVDTFLLGKTCQVFAAPFDVRLTTGGANGNQQIRTVVQPDLCVVCEPAKLDARGCLGAPDWIIEIVSPGTAIHDTRTKFDLYAENGVAEYWIVYPGEQSIAVFVLQAGEYQAVGEYYEPGLVPSHTLPELALQWADVFAGV
ncbi:Uma2 family endonuclease [Hymenobacter sp. BRD67]|uniref:Uma2 family endonuclease n=1 Tax=Hymenobacter sp. BRD67 TaxID=2675877 RepID=UPI0015675B82|nr:Uma2 family endonuclease [Hymenobacter sp. BRD67]QKG52974.1 Uma2 family endonuclease [Hymenobacter sp. BRD67]